MGRRVDTDDLWTSKKVGEYLGLGLHDPTGAAGARAVSLYRTRHPDFPKPIVEEPNCVIWVGKDIRAWRAERPGRKKSDDE